MTSQEDALVNALIEYKRQSHDEFNDQGPATYELQIYPEAHYNNYGNRGVADLYWTRSGDHVAVSEGHVFEIKSESAVVNATGANEIIRQFNRMRENFFEGTEHVEPHDSVTFELCFTPTAVNLQHVIDNAGMYRSVREQSGVDISSNRSTTLITMRAADAENITPIHLFTRHVDCADTQRFLEQNVRYNRPELYDELSAVLE